MISIALIDYQMGNLSSVSKALTAAGACVNIVSSPAETGEADALVLPGVGSFGDAMHRLDEYGWIPVIREWIAADKPFLGICLGLQMLLDSSEESPGVPGLGVFRGKVRKFPEGRGEKIPHMGWNTVNPSPDSPFFSGTPDGSYFYFVHSFYVDPDAPSLAAAHTDYIFPFISAISKGALLATQFHPEKSQERGLALLRTFVKTVEERKTAL